MSILTTGKTVANVTVKLVNGSIQSGTKVNPVSLVSIGTGGTISRFDQLVDVVEGTPANGDVVVYNATTDKYEVKTLDVTDTITDTVANAQLDGGSF